MSSVKMSSVAKMKSILRRQEKRMGKRVSSHRRDEILATAMDLSPGIQIPDRTKEAHEKICHIIYHHFSIAGDIKLNADSRRVALDVARKLLKIVKDAVRGENQLQNTTAIANATATTSSQRKIADQASKASGKENLLEEAKQSPPQVAATKNGSTISSRPQATNPSPSQQLQRNSSGSGALGQQQHHKLQRNSFSLSHYCQANDAYKETNLVGVGKSNAGTKPPPVRKPPPYQENSPLLGGGKEAQKRHKDSSKQLPNHDEAHRKRVAEDQKRAKAKQLEEQRRREEAKKREDERLANQQRAEKLKKEEEKRKRLQEEKRKKEEAERKRIEEQQKRERQERIRLEEEKRKREEIERKRVEEQRRKKEEERKRLEEAKRKEEAEQKRKEQERRKKEAERKKEEEKRKKAEKQKRQEELRKEKERKRAAELKREKKESEVSAVMQAAEEPRNMEMRVVFPADSAKPFRNNGLFPRPETVIRFVPHRMNKTQALNMATRLLRWDPYWSVCKYVKCGMTTAGDDVSGGEKKFGASFSFSVSGSDIREMRTSDWGVVSLGVEDSQMRLILRMIPVTSSDKNRADLHLWPKGTYLYLNGKSISPSQRKQQEHAHTKWQGLCKPLDLTEHIQRPTDRNEIKILTVEGAPYYFCIALCRYMSPAKLMKQYLTSEPGVFFAPSFPKLNLEQSKAKAKSFTQQATFTLDDSDEEEAAQPDASSGKFVFTLTCPFSKTILKHPVRGRQCKHYQCFDLSNFLTSNKTVRGNQWRCMVCEQFVSFYDLSLDSLVGDLAYEFREELVPTDRDRIEYRADATYTLLGTKKPRYNNKKRPLPDASSSSNLAPKKKDAAPANAEPEIILLDDDDD